MLERDKVTVGVRPSQRNEERKRHCTELKAHPPALLRGHQHDDPEDVAKRHCSAPGNHGIRVDDPKLSMPEERSARHQQLPKPAELAKLAGLDRVQQVMQEDHCETVESDCPGRQE